jgi:hypothetical protein
VTLGEHEPRQRVGQQLHAHRGPSEVPTPAARCQGDDEGNLDAERQQERGGPEGIDHDAAGDCPTATGGPPGHRSHHGGNSAPLLVPPPAAAASVVNNIPNVPAAVGLRLNAQALLVSWPFDPRRTNVMAEAVWRWPVVPAHRVQIADAIHVAL